MNCATSMLSTVISGSFSLVMMIKLCCLTLSSFRPPCRYAVDAAAGEVSTREVRVHQAGRLEVRPAEVRPGEVGPVEVCLHQVRPVELRPAEEMHCMPIDIRLP